VMNIRKKKKQ
jgi:hypothetical protein